MKGWHKEEKELVESLLWYLLNDKDVNEWEHGFIKSIIESKQYTYTDKQLSKLEDIIEKCKWYEYSNIMKLVINSMK